ncbi:MAG: pyrrolysine biosynthesis protein PylC [Desulforhopalus sp.]|jgi:pyrrolysine biosynthesis protein PylC
MRIAVIGGKLQGVEIIYLAKEAGFETLLVDRNDCVPARGLCDEFISFNYIKEGRWPTKLKEIDLIFPALEDTKTLRLLYKWAQHINVPVVLDLASYGISSSKRLSNAVFEKLGLPLPHSLAETSFPVVVKPDNASGSSGVTIARNQNELDLVRDDATCEIVIQEYLEGPSFSVEIIGRPGNYVTLQATDLFMDELYDCSGVAAPTHLDSPKIDELHEQILLIAEEISLHGIMDLEVILHDGKLKILEIDARFPSQTPITVYHSTGMNMVNMLAKLFLEGAVEKKPGACVHSRIDHVKVEAGTVEVCGEHIMAEDGSLRLVTGLFGAYQALTTYQPGKTKWVATFIFRGSDRQEVEAKRESCLQKIRWIQPGEDYSDDKIIAQGY